MEGGVETEKIRQQRKKAGNSVVRLQSAIKFESERARRRLDLC
jgi:hypothetical protein